MLVLTDFDRSLARNIVPNVAGAAARFRTLEQIKGALRGERADTDLKARIRIRAEKVDCLDGATKVWTKLLGSSQ